QTRDNVRDQAPQARDSFKDQASRTTDTVRDQAPQARDTVRDQASQTMGNVREQTSQAMGNVGRQAGQTIDNFKDQASQTMGGVREQTSQTMGSVRDQVTGGSFGNQTAQQSATPASQSARDDLRPSAPTQQTSGAQSTAPMGPFTAAEWKTLLELPLKVGRAMMVVAPSGPVGLLQEAMAMGKSVQALMGQDVQNPLLKALGGQLKAQLEAAQANGQNPFASMSSAGGGDPQAIRQDALTSCQQILTTISKIPQQDANAYKQFILGTAQNVAMAASEGGFLGMGGEQVSAEERSLLNDLAKALGFQQRS
ncbi:MAG TPA: hypothetical protein VKR06_30730, partial [Ktedonosporobacter sp.]|nr:hypothetical protein [Ktedonosporobacter sp.]